MSIVNAAFDVYARHRFASLFYTMLATLGLRPVLETLGLDWDLLEILLAVNFIAAIASVAREHGGLLVIGAVFLAARISAAVLGIDAVVSASKGVWILGCLLATTITVRHVMRPGVIDRERIFAALDVYILVALVFAICFQLLDEAWPGSFRTPTGEPFTEARAIYFSFVTIATLGYGDIVPTNDAGQGLAVVEAVGGQMYLAVLVARLVSLYVKEHG